MKLSLLPKIKPRCFSDSVWLTWELLKVRLGWTGFLSFLLKITSCACLVWSGLYIIFHWQAHLLIFPRLLMSSSVLAAMFRTIEKSDVSSANNFALVIKPSGRSLIINYETSIFLDWTFWYTGFSINPVRGLNIKYKSLFPIV